MRKWYHRGTYVLQASNLRIFMAAHENIWLPEILAQARKMVVSSKEIAGTLKRFETLFQAIEFIIRSLNV